MLWPLIELGKNVSSDKAELDIVRHLVGRGVQQVLQLVHVQLTMRSLLMVKPLQ